MQILYTLEDIRTPFLNKIMSCVTLLGGETVFLFLAIVVFWCFSKKHGYYMLTVGSLGTVINQFMKLVFNVPRPWVRDANFTIVESARDGAAGYSFPSGHTQSALSSFGSMARFTKRKIIRAVCIILIAFTAFSRMYLGVHTLLDVGVSLGIGIVILFVLYPPFNNLEDNPKAVFLTLTFALACSVSYVLFAELYSWPSDIDAENLAEGIKNGYMILGSVAGMVIAFYLDVKYIRFVVKAKWWAQIIKVVIGLGIILFLKIGLKTPLLNLFGGHEVSHGVRYFIITMFAAVLWPLTFKWFNKGCPFHKYSVDMA